MAEWTPGGRRLYRRIGYPLQALAAWLVYGFFALLPIDAASGLGGLLGRAIGPRLPLTERARRNLALAMPELAPAARETIVREMWDNLGRTLGEFPHIQAIARNAGRAGARVEIVGGENAAALRQPGQACLLFSGHLANWEVFPLAARAVGLSCAQVYRPANNPFVDTMLRRVRQIDDADLVPKGAAGARKAVAVLRGGRRLGLLVDQKANDGIASPFFGRPAMSPPAVAQLALRFGCPIIPVRIERRDGCRFRITLHAPLEMPSTGDRHADIAEGMRRINAVLESWIRERPGQWLWLHRRWPES